MEVRRSDGKEAEDRESLRTMFGQASAFARPLFGKCLPIPYRFSIDFLSFAYVNSREKVEKRKAGDRRTPKLVRRSSEQDTYKLWIKHRSSKNLALSSLWLSAIQEQTAGREIDCFDVVSLPYPEQAPRNDEKVPKRYCKGTGKVLNSGGKDTGEVLESYQRGTTDVLAGSKSVVALERDAGTSSRHCAAFRPVGNGNAMERSDLSDRLPRFTHKDGNLVIDPYMNKLIVRDFRELCEEFRGEV